MNEYYKSHLLYYYYSTYPIDNCCHSSSFVGSVVVLYCVSTEFFLLFWGLEVKYVSELELVLSQ